MDVLEFGKILVTTEDLDPLYVALYRAKMPKRKLDRWLVAYWCYYHAGLCSRVAESRDFFGELRKIALGGTLYPRGTERRHFRGKLAEDSVESLRQRFSDATEIVEWLLEVGPRADKIMKRVTELHGFGEWIKWKVPDMLDRLEVGRVEFRTEDLRQMFKTSKQGAEVTCEACGIDSADSLLSAHEYLIENLGYLTAPPIHERTINVQETETIFCKWKSHLGGHYPIGKDTRELIHGCLKFPCSTNKKLVGILKAIRRRLPSG